MKRNIYLLFLVAWLLLATMQLYSRDEKPLTLRGKITQEYRFNFIRLPDSLKIDDNRMNFFLNSDFSRKFWNNGRIGFSYEISYHNYDEYHLYDRHDHIGILQFKKPVKGSVKLHLSNEFRSRFSSTKSYSYYRNIFDTYLNVPITSNDRAYIGFQNWWKNYPKTSEYLTYMSNRIYSKLNIRLTPKATLGMKLEYQKHDGNLYPGSTAPTLQYELDGNRFVVQTTVDQIFHSHLFASFTYRYENDLPGEIENRLTGERVNDESSEDLLAEDSDFGYLKNQGSMSVVFKVTPRISMMAFYLVYSKKFKFWYLEEDGPRRSDRLIFISHLLKMKMTDKLAFEIHYIFEDNHTNLKFYEYKMNSISAGLSIEY